MFDGKPGRGNGCGCTLDLEVKPGETHLPAAVKVRNEL